MKSGMHKTVNRRLAGATLCLAVTIMNPVAAQEYTLQDFVNDADAIVVAEIISKKAEWMTVHTPQPDGSISTGRGISTRYGIAVKEFIGQNRYSNIHEFVLPGGVIGTTGVRWTHTPEFETGMVVLISVDYDELNGYFTLQGIPPIGRSGAVFVKSNADERQVFIPYVRRGDSNREHLTGNDKRILSDLKRKTEMLDIATSMATDYGSLVSAIREASDEKK